MGIFRDSDRPGRQAAWGDGLHTFSPHDKRHARDFPGID